MTHDRAADPGDAVTRAWRIQGRVQGVGFRWWTVKTGDRLGLAGRVWNAPDGSVVLHVRGPAEGVAELSDRVREGPSLARVERVDEIDPSGPWPEDGIEVIRS